MATISHIGDWCREQYSPDGVEVASQGTRSLTLKVPANLPLTEICAELWNTFGATLELQQTAGSNTVTIIVWQGTEDAALHTNENRANKSQGSSNWTSVVFGAMITLMSGCIVEYGVIPAFNGTANLGLRFDQLREFFFK